MEERISSIKKLGLKKEDMQSIIMFDKGLSGSDLKFLEDEFDFYREDIDKFGANYKNLALVFKLMPANKELLTDWKEFIQKVIKRSYDSDKFENVFLNKAYDKILLVTNKRLVEVDLGKLNEKIEEINYRIESYDEKVKVEMDEMAEATKGGHKGFFGRIMRVLEK